MLRPPPQNGIHIVDLETWTCVVFFGRPYLPKNKDKAEKKAATKRQAKPSARGAKAAAKSKAQPKMKAEKTSPPQRRRK